MTSLLSASSLVRPLLAQPVQSLVPVERSRYAWQLAGGSGRVACVLATPDAIALPHAVFVDALPDLAVPLAIGDGSFHIGTDSYRPHRWWSAPRPVLTVEVDLETVARLRDSWADQLGLGPGLTPYGDDVLCGSLVVLAATGTASDLRETIANSDLESRTTTTSATLLRLACNGYCIAVLAEYLGTLTRGRDVSAARDRLLAVGHSSGRGLLAGVTALLTSTSRAAA